MSSRLKSAEICSAWNWIRRILKKKKTHLVSTKIKHNFIISILFVIIHLPVCTHVMIKFKIVAYRNCKKMRSERRRRRREKLLLVLQFDRNNNNSNISVSMCSVLLLGFCFWFSRIVKEMPIPFWANSYPYGKYNGLTCGNRIVEYISMWKLK